MSLESKTALTPIAALRVLAGVGVALFLLLAALAPSALAVQITEYPLPEGSKPLYIAAGPDGNLWFTDNGLNEIGKVTTSGQVTEYGLGLTPSAGFAGIAAGPDGNLWFTERKGHKVGRITPSGAITEFSSGLTGPPDIYGITAGPEGKMWFTETSAHRVGNIDPASGTIHEIAAPAGVYTKIVQGPDGNLWYTMVDKAQIARLTPSGVATLFGPLPAGDCAVGASAPCPYPESIAVGGDGNLWFDEAKGDAIGRITTSGNISEYRDGLTHSAHVADLSAGSEGNVWFTENAVSQVGRITPSGTISEFNAGISAGAKPFGIALGADQNLWMVEPGVGKVARVIPDVPPVVATGSAVGASTTGVTVNGTVRSRGADTHYSFQYGSAGDYGESTSAADAGAGDDTTAVSAAIGGLSPGQTYHYRVVASNASGTSYGQDATFATANPPKRHHHRRKVTVGPFEMYFAGYVSGNRLRLSKVVVIRVRRGDLVSFRCAHCHGSPSHRNRRARRAKVVFRRLGLFVDRRSLLQVAVVAKDGSKRVKSYGFRVGKAQAKLKRQRCFVRGRHKAVRCPGSHSGHGHRSKGSKSTHRRKGHRKGHAKHSGG